MAHWSQVVSVVNYSASEAMASWQILEALLWSQPHRSCWSVQKIAPRPAWSKVYENTSKEKSTWFKNFDRQIRMQIIFPIFIELQYEKSRNKDIDKEGFYISFHPYWCCTTQPSWVWMVGKNGTLSFSRKIQGLGYWTFHIWFRNWEVGIRLML